MYNGIGLNTSRGSGTNGFVQRNLSLVNPNRHKPNYRTEEEIRRKEEETTKGPNLEILEHQRKRALELKCVEMEEVLEDEGYSRSEIDERITEFRSMLMEREERAKKTLADAPEFSNNSKETHAVAAAQLQKNARLKEAFGISKYFVEGSSLDPDRKAKEEAARQLKQRQEDEKAKEALKKKYEWVATPSPSPERPPKEKKHKKDKKKSKKKRDRSSSPESRKKHKSKKSKRSRSHSPKKKKHGKHRRRDKARKKIKNSPTSRSKSSSTERKSGTDKIRSPKRVHGDADDVTEKFLETPRKKSKTHHRKPENTDKWRSDSEKRRSESSILKKKDGQGPLSIPNDDYSPPRVNVKSDLTSKISNMLSTVESNDYFGGNKAKRDLMQSLEQHVSPLVQARGPPLSITKPAIIPKVLTPPKEPEKIKVVPPDSPERVSPVATAPVTTSSGKLGGRPLISPFKINKTLDKSVLAPPTHTSPIMDATIGKLPFFNGTKLKLAKNKKQDHLKTKPSFLQTQKKPEYSPSSKASERRSRSRSFSDRSRSRSSRSRSRSRSKSSSRSTSRRSSHSGYRSMSISPSRSATKSRSRSWSRSRSRSRFSSRSRSYSESRSRSRSRSHKSRSRSDKSRSRSHKSRSRSHKSRSRSNYSRSSRSRSSFSRSRSRSGSPLGSPAKSRARSRSLSIPRRRGSPSFLDKRRITSARKRPVPYYRPTPPPSPSSSESSWWSRSRSRSWSRTRTPSYDR